MRRQDLWARAAELRAKRVPFVLARVVLAQPPTSAKPGDEAIVLADGTVEGFVGGTCAEATVGQEALALLESGGTTMLRVTPVPEDPRPGTRVVHNPCLSGGTLEVYLESEVPPPLVAVVGRTPIAAALGDLGARLGYDLRAFEGPLPPDTAAVVVASHGRGEESALSAALEAGVPYVGLVASRQRGRAVVDALPAGEADKARIRTPAGLDIGATTAQEIALSILAEIVQSGARPARPSPAPTAVPGPVRDPVCGMPVAPGEEALQLDQDGRTVWFCGRGCLEAFAADPASYRS